MAVDSGSRKTQVTMGVVLPLVLLGLLIVLAVLGDDASAAVGLMAAVPVLAAVFATSSQTTLVAAATVIAALVVSLVPVPDDIASILVPLVGVVAFAALAVVGSQARADRREAAPVTVERRKGIQFQLQTQADTDSLTGLLNRRGAIRSLGTRNDGDERVVAFIDCDWFKEVNLQYGDDVGDEFLQAISGRLRHGLPPLDTVARWDGDEFLVSIAAHEQSARPALERVMRSLSGHPIRTTVGPIASSVSIGAAAWAPGQELEQVIARAGRALYSAKSAGRGRIAVDGEDRGPVTVSDPDRPAVSDGPGVG